MLQNGSVEYDLYDLQGQLVYSFKPALNKQTDFLNLAGKPLAELVNGIPTYLHPDLLGSPRLATSATKAIVWREHFDPYGQKLNSVNDRTGYTGHAYDQESGLTYAQARFYDPMVGRFLSTDPITFQDGDPGTFNRYAYVNDSPYNHTDPTGMACGTGSHIDGASVSSCSVTLDRSESEIRLGTTKSPPPTVMEKPFLPKGGMEQAFKFFYKETAKLTIAALGGGVGMLGTFGEAAVAAEEALIPARLARVVPAEFARSPTLAGPGATDAFVTSANDIAGINSGIGLAERLTLVDASGNLISGARAVIEFDTPASGLASPVFRTNPGFIGGGKTTGGANEFVLPNLPINQLHNVTTRIVPP